MKDLTNPEIFNSATPQEIFDFAANHLLTQNQKSIRGTGCKYKSHKNLKCAAGCFISDDRYSKSFETNTWDVVSKELGMVNQWHLVRDLQVIHDHTYVIQWKSELKILANKHDLNSNILEQFN